MNTTQKKIVGKKSLNYFFNKKKNFYFNQKRYKLLKKKFYFVLRNLFNFFANSFSDFENLFLENGFQEKKNSTKIIEIRKFVFKTIFMRFRQLDFELYSPNILREYFLLENTKLLTVVKLPFKKVEKKLLKNLFKKIKISLEFKSIKKETLILEWIMFQKNVKNTSKKINFLNFYEIFFKNKSQTLKNNFKIERSFKKKKIFTADVEIIFFYFIFNYWNGFKKEIKSSI
jgi:hypothetical protein